MIYYVLELIYDGLLSPSTVRRRIVPTIQLVQGGLIFIFSFNVVGSINEMQFKFIPYDLHMILLVL